MDQETVLSSVPSFDVKNDNDSSILVPYNDYSIPRVSGLDINSLLVKKCNDNRPYLQIEILGQSCLALLDSGSNISLLGSHSLEMLDKANISISPISSLQVSTADGTIQSIVGKFETEILVANIRRNITFYIIPSVQNSIILGMDFLNIFNSTLDCSDFSLCISPLNLSTLTVIHDFSSLSVSQQKQLEAIMSKFSSISSKDKLGRTSLISHTIEVNTSTPFRQYQYPIPQAWHADLGKEIDSMLSLNIIEPSTSS
ncbi:uncharacterized protein [Diabrotica undecimpunctata]|uniref:uncharacterized protein n=1 Tax=Diabrotica undecimpunctata TaxID=50387 RepID=UPI003B638923